MVDSPRIIPGRAKVAETMRYEAMLGRMWRKMIAPSDAPRGRGREDKLLLPQGQVLPPHHPGEARPADQREDVTTPK